MHKAGPTRRTMSETDWESLKLCPLFRYLDDETVQHIAETGRIVTFDRGAQIFAQGDVSDAFYIVLDGWVKLYRLTPAGDESVMAVMPRGDSFAEAAVFLGGRYPVCASAAAPVRLLRMEHAALLRSLQESPGLPIAMLSSMARHSSELAEQIQELKLLNAPRRVAEFLVNKSPPDATSAEIELPYEKALIAASLGMTPESFSRALAALDQFGVSSTRDIVIIDDLIGLRAYASDT